MNTAFLLLGFEEWKDKLYLTLAWLCKPRGMFADLSSYPLSNTTQNSNMCGNWSSRIIEDSGSPTRGRGPSGSCLFLCGDVQEFCSLDSQGDVSRRSQLFKETAGACLIVCIVSQNGSRIERYFLKRRGSGLDIFEIQTVKIKSSGGMAVGGLSVNRQIYQENEYVS